MEARNAASKEAGQSMKATLALFVAVTTLSVGCGVNRSPGAPSGTSHSRSTSSSHGIDVASLQGKILFTRAGDQYGDATVYTANANGTDQRRITGFGKQCCVRWSPDGSQILMGALTADARLTAGFYRPNGTFIRSSPLPPGGLNLGCGQAYSAATGMLACEGWNDHKPSMTGIYTLKASDRADLRQLTRNPAHDIPAGFSPDGSRIYFFRPVPSFPAIGNQPDGSLYVVDANGKDLHRVTPANLPVEAPGNAGGRLSADGRWIVFTSAGVIWKIHPNGSALTKVYDDPHGRLALTPTWSPDGAYILFALDPAGTLAIVDNPPVDGLYVIRADGTGLTPVITSNDWKRNPDWVAAN